MSGYQGKKNIPRITVSYGISSLIITKYEACLEIFKILWEWMCLICNANERWSELNATLANADPLLRYIMLRYSG